MCIEGLLWRVVDILSQKALAAVDRYSAFLDQLRTQLTAAVRADPSRGDVQRSARASSVRLAQGFVQRENDLISADTAEIAQIALSDVSSELGVTQPVELNPDLTTHIELTGDILGRTLAAQVERDVGTFMREVAIAGLNVKVNTEAGLSQAEAVLSVLADKPKIASFRFIDRIGRKYNSTKHVRDMYRQHLLNSYNEIYLHSLAGAGYDLASIWHPDVNSEAYGQKLSITSGGDFPSYYDVQDQFFHPTSQALVRANVES